MYFFGGENVNFGSKVKKLSLNRYTNEKTKHGLMILQTLNVKPRDKKTRSNLINFMKF